MVVHTVMQRNARLARAIAGHDEKPGFKPRRDLTSEEKRIARRMVHKGATTPEIARAINWPMTVYSLYIKLKAINIKPKGAWTNYLHRE